MSSEPIQTIELDKPFSVCMHRNPPAEPMRQIVTCLLIVMNLRRRQIHYTPGNPCRGEV
jgi:hypothetical protein